MCLTLGGVVRQTKAQEGDAVADGILAAWSDNELTALSATDAVQATAATYGRCVAENWYRLCSGQYQACDIRALFASDAASQAEAQYLYDLNTYWLLLVGASPAAGTTTSAAFNPVVTSIQVASDGQTATATVVAGWTREERSSDATKNQNTVDNNAVCTLALRYENGKWLITHEDCPDDDLRRAQFPTGTDFAALTQTVPAQRAAVDKHEKEAEAAWQQEVQHMRDTGDPRYAFLPEKDRQLAPPTAGSSTTTTPLSPMYTYASYSGTKALTYSNTYYFPYNGFFYNFNSSGGDCQNFGSQCVWIGFGGINTASMINSHVYPMISTSVSGAVPWYADATSTAASSWISGTAFETMVRGNLSSNAYGVQASCGANNEDGGAPVSSIVVGDIVRVHYHDPNYNHLLDVFHTMVVVQANGTYNGIYVSSHNDDFQCHHLSYSQSVVDLIHIVTFCNPPGT